MTDRGSPSDRTAAEASGAVTCYRHPDREAHIRCTRCNRRICPDCMVNASVGFQCPECVRAGNKGVRQARTALGGRVSDDPGYVTKVLIALNVLAFIAQTASSVFERRLILIGRAFDGASVVGVAEGEYYRLLTGAFLHSGFLHIALNMYALFLFGPALEAALGRLRFVVVYVVSALGGSALSYAFSAPNQASLGASGAVFGLLGAFFVVNRRMGRETSGLVVLVAINLVLGFVVRNIDWRAHVGGLVTGAALALVLAYAPRARRGPLQTAGVVVVLLVVLALVAWRTAQLST